MASDIRSEMPETAMIIDRLREAFGREIIDQMLKNSVGITRKYDEILAKDGIDKASQFASSLKNVPFFYSAEGDKTFGTKLF